MRRASKPGAFRPSGGVSADVASQLEAIDGMRALLDYEVKDVKRLKGAAKESRHRQAVAAATAEWAGGAKRLAREAEKAEAELAQAMDALGDTLYEADQACDGAALLRIGAAGPRPVRIALQQLRQADQQAAKARDTTRAETHGAAATLQAEARSIRVAAVKARPALRESVSQGIGLLEQRLDDMAAHAAELEAEAIAMPGLVSGDLGAASGLATPASTAPGTPSGPRPGPSALSSRAPSTVGGKTLLSAADAADAYVTEPLVAAKLEALCEAYSIPHPVYGFVGGPPGTPSGVQDSLLPDVDDGPPVVESTAKEPAPRSPEEKASPAPSAGRSESPAPSQATAARGAGVGATNVVIVDGFGAAALDAARTHDAAISEKAAEAAALRQRLQGILATVGAEAAEKLPLLARGSSVAAVQRNGARQQSQTQAEAVLADRICMQLGRSVPTATVRSYLSFRQKRRRALQQLQQLRVAALSALRGVLGALEDALQQDADATALLGVAEASAAERRRQDEGRRERMAQLREVRAERDAEAEAAAAEVRRREEAAEAERERQRQALQDARKAHLEQWREYTAEQQAEAAEREAAERAAQEAEAKVRRAENERRVEHRREQREQRLQDHALLREQQEYEQQEKEYELEAFFQRVQARIGAQQDTNRLRSHTAASHAATDGPRIVSVSEQASRRATGFTDDRLARDPRARVQAALSAAGLMSTPYAHNVLQGMARVAAHNQPSSQNPLHPQAPM